MKAYLNAAEVAKLLHVDRATVSRWIKKGLLKGAIRPSGKQQRRIPLSAYEQLRTGAVTAERALADEGTPVSTATAEAGETARPSSVRYAQEVQLEREDQRER